MAILSITFHIEENRIIEWNKYLEDNLIPHIQSLGLPFLLSNVDTEMLSEGQNNNLLLFFNNREEREIFIQKDFPKLCEPAMQEFQKDIIIFKTLLNSLAKRL